ncbi:MAG: phosphoenolpyruvate--protein phosphotransferase [Fusobacterium gastrosuis]|uniref:phosphoenolpyruvate--protein phosphotransferase n=1 Tax=Fusobacterium gastrosuis TaxID=1755100 RepID=UPI001F4FB623|nr:phosphoenolpyruvate--protein phosphotransferase [Fusobacterium gastrosuis]MDD7392594.1 phosphoenolpyruvate--protein phosphotransferase [Fusobacteriaceae bacterium]MDY5794651.1 phosphoenolpyruvate--protein phosphotransferase [Fusobacterium gastrosuis]
MNRVINGIAASPGVAIGKIFIYRDIKLNYAEKSLISKEKEIERLILGREIAKKQLEEIRDNTLLKMGKDKAAIFDGHITLLEDEDLFTEINDKINSENNTAEYALNEAIEEYASMLANLEDTYFKERAGDLRDIGKRWLYGVANVNVIDLSKLPPESIIVAKELNPSDTAQLNLENVLAFVTEIGGKTAHSSIMARSLELPAVVGVGELLDSITSEENIIVDALNGKVIINPDKENLKIYTEKRNAYLREKEELKELKDKEAISKDGVKIDIWGNIGSPKDVKGVLSNGGFGIGLYRTEFLFMDKESFPTEDEQFEAYKEVAIAMGTHPVTIRTMDIGGDKSLPYMELPKEENPFLGWRAIRICLDRTEILKTQFRALLRASKYGNIKIMLPMIMDVNEIRKSKEIFEECKKELREEGVEFNETVMLGIMVETPAVAFRAKYFAKECDFFSIGTNDLTQYTLAVDRGNEKIANLYDSYNPAVLQAIKLLIDGAHEGGIKISMCGEFAGDENAVALLFGMGLDAFSMSGISIPRIKKILKNLDSKKCQKLVEEVLEFSTADEVKEKVKNFMNNL